jgi:hypothetical protein
VIPFKRAELSRLVAKEPSVVARKLVASWDCYTPEFDNRDEEAFAHLYFAWLRLVFSIFYRALSMAS